MTQAIPCVSTAERAYAIRDQLPSGGLFAGQRWRVAPCPFPLAPRLVEELEQLGQILVGFYQSANLLYRQSVAGKQPEWIAQRLDQGKSRKLIELQRAPPFRQEIPRVIRPDLLLTEDGVSITELDNVPGGIGLTAWLNQAHATSGDAVIGGADGMLEGFAAIFGQAPRAHVVVSEEAAMYRPEMNWLCQQLSLASGGDCRVRDEHFLDFREGDAIYRFFELFDIANVPNASAVFDHGLYRRGYVTPPPKPFLEEKLLFALLWNGNLEGFWRQHLGSGYLRRLREATPYTWLVDPTPLPPHAVIPGLELVDWQQLKQLSQKERELVLKVSGFSEEAWGARGVYLGSDLSAADWAAAVDRALDEFEVTPYILQRFIKPRTVETEWFDFERGEVLPMLGRVRLCPYYFVTGQGDTARAHLKGVLATICSVDKKIIHGMKDAVLTPCSIQPQGKTGGSDHDPENEKETRTD